MRFRCKPQINHQHDNIGKQQNHNAFHRQRIGMQQQKHCAQKYHHAQREERAQKRRHQHDRNVVDFFHIAHSAVDRQEQNKSQHKFQQGNDKFFIFCVKIFYVFSDYKQLCHLLFPLCGFLFSILIQAVQILQKYLPPLLRFCITDRVYHIGNCHI